MHKAAVMGTLGALALWTLALPPAVAEAPPPGSADEARGAALAAQRAEAAGISWGPCDPAENLREPVECGTVTVPVDYAAPDGDTIELHVSRLKATGPEKERQGALLYNPGGPGANGMVFPLYPLHLDSGPWQNLHRAYDFVGFAPRGVGRSAPVSCQDPGTFQRGPSPAPRTPSEEFKRQMNLRAAAYAAGCLAGQGDRLAHFTTPNNARDLHTIRAALGEQRLTYLGASYGTYIGSVYATLFPGSVGRMVLDSAVDPDPAQVWYGNNLRQSYAFEGRWQDWKQWVAGHHDVYGLGRTAQEVQRGFDRARDQLEDEPVGETVGPKQLHDAFLSVTYSDRSWPVMATALAEYLRGEPGPLVQQARPDPQDAARAENGNAVYAAVECTDAPWPRDWRRWDRDHTRLARVAPFETWENAWMNLPCAHWPVEQAAPLDVGAAPDALPPVLVVAATRDAATPYRGALELHRRLPGSTLVTEDGAGNHGVTGGNACADAHIEEYLLHGRTAGSQLTCPARPAPEPAYLAPEPTVASQLLAHHGR
ncbi:alpha/beta hydrolase [Streptomyces sodiiphilus]|uniref:Alpha/beta hydrolase n=1 Tax=Streptomyces sodiiphilus TaxID=226217 RepID=A0ABN2P3A3_9ACTN